MNDLRYAIRMLIKSPAFSVIAIGALALGIGANTAIFSVINAVLLRPLPLPDPDELIFLRERMQLFESGAVSYPNYLDWRAAQRVFTDLALFRRDSMNLAGAGEETPPERVGAGQVTWNFLRIVGVKPVLGRDFAEAEDVPGGPKVALISEGLWQRRFAGSKKAIGQCLTIDALPREIIGVVPNEMQLMRKAQVFIPLGDLRGQKEVLQRDNHPGFSGLGRLKHGETLARARDDLDNIARDLERQYPDSNTGRRITSQTLLDASVGDYRESLHLLLAAVACVLLIACANVANLQLARALSRAKELAVRAALGASRSRLMRLLLIESAILGLAGGAAGLLIAVWSVDAIHVLSPAQSLRFQETRIDFLTLGFGTVIALLCGLLVGIWPAWHVSRLASLSGVLHETGTRSGSDSAGRQRARGALVITQVALALVLLAGAGLTLKSFWRSENAPLGFEPRGVLTMTLALPRARYDSDEKIVGFYSRLLERVKVLPGVAAAAIGENVPFDDTEWDSSFHITGTPPSLPGTEPSAEVNMISPDYFEVLGMPVLRGRGFGSAEIAGRPRSVIIDDSFAARYFPNKDPIGLHIDDNQADEKHPPPLTVIGVVPRVLTDTPGDKFDRLKLPQMYFSASQLATRENSLLVRVSKGDPLALAEAVKREILAVDPDQPVATISTMEKNIGESLATRRLTMTLLGFFAALALILASVGLYGVMALSVTQRTREFGIRLALGAARRDVFHLAFGRGLVLVGMGMAVGLCGAVAVGRSLTSLLYDVGSFEPAALCTAIVALAGAGLLACWFPARRATRVDPIVALRYE